MAMTKKEQAEMAGLRDQLDIARALSWPTQPKPEPMTREEIEANRNGKVKNRYGGLDNVCIAWKFNAWMGGTVSVNLGFSTGCNHGSDAKYPHSQSQGMGEFYRTRDEAILAARWKLCEEAARVLARLDKAAPTGDDIYFG